MHIGLFFGSFNPIHQGHLEIAKYFLSPNTSISISNRKLDEVWLVLSPQNPFKDAQGLAPVVHRQAMLELALKAYNNSKIKPCYEELSFSPPTYTACTLEFLANKYSTHVFYLIIGEDNARILPSWHRGEWIRLNYEILVYPRTRNSQRDLKDSNLPPPAVTPQDAPLLTVSASSIRDQLVSYYKNSDEERMPEELMPLLPEEVFLYIKKHLLYSK